MADIINHNMNFEIVTAIIEQSKIRRIKAVNSEMIEMYWQIGKYSAKRRKAKVGAKASYKSLPIY